MLQNIKIYFAKKLSDLSRWLYGNQRKDFYQPPDGYIMSNEDTGLYWLKSTTRVKVNGLPTLLQTEAITFTENNIADGETIFKVKRC